LRDLPAVWQRKFEGMTGTIIRYKAKIYGGEPPTVDYRPVVKDNLTGKEFVLVIVNRKDLKPRRGEIVGAEHYGTHNFS